MTGYYGIGAIDSLGYDPMAMQALYSPNYYQLLAQQTSQAQAQAQAQTQTAGTQLQTVPGNAATYQYNPSFSGNYTQKQDSGSGIGSYIAGGIALAGTAALLYASYKKGGGNIKNIPEGFKEVCKSGWNWAKGLIGKGEKNIINNAGKNLKEYTIMSKDGVEVLMKGGNPVKIITKDKKAITEAGKISDWLKSNSKVSNLINNLDVSGKLPKGVSLSYTKEVKEGNKLYKMVVENGQVKQAFGKDGKGKWVEVAKEQFEAFKTNHASAIKDAETLTKTLKDKTVRFADGSTQKGALKMSVRNGKVTEAFLNGKKLTDKEIAMLKNDFAEQIKQFGKESGAAYGLKEFEYIYRTSADASNGIVGGQTFRFGTNVPGHAGKNWVTNANVITTNAPMTSKTEIEKFLSNNPEFNTKLQSFVAGNQVKGFNIMDAVVKSANGNTFTVNPNSGIVKSITLANGTVLSGKDVQTWFKTAENYNDYSTIAKQCGLKLI